MTDNAWIADPMARLQVWRVTVQRAEGGIVPVWPPIRCPAYTAGEAVQFAAVHSGIPRDQWGHYTFHPEPMRVTP